MIFFEFLHRLRQLAVLELSSFLPFRAYFGFENLGEPFPFETIPLAIEFVLDDFQQIRFVRSAVPCFALPFVFVNHHALVE